MSAGTIKATPHPEAKPSEVFIANTTSQGFWDIGWHSKRAGKVAYMSNGEPIVDSDLFPVFVARAEIEAMGFRIEEQSI